jgi:hypothetical protein
MFLRKVEFTLNGLHGVSSQKIEVFITTAVRTSTPTEDKEILTEILHQMK